MCAVGDGANDLPMLGIVGMGIAFRAKPLFDKQPVMRSRFSDWTACSI